jgi:hypothetical protein
MTCHPGAALASSGRPPLQLLDSQQLAIATCIVCNCAVAGCDAELNTGCSESRAICGRAQRARCPTDSVLTPNATPKSSGSFEGRHAFPQGVAAAQRHLVRCWTLAIVRHGLPASCAALARCCKPHLPSLHQPGPGRTTDWLGASWSPTWRPSLNAAAGAHRLSMWKLSQTALVQHASLHVRLQAALLLGHLSQEP